MELKLQIDSIGQALIHVSKARALHQSAYMKIKSCPACKMEDKQRLLDGIEFLNNLLSQLKELADEVSR